MYLKDLVPESMEICVKHAKLFDELSLHKLYLKPSGKVYERVYDKGMFKYVVMPLDSVFFFDDKWEQVK